MGQMADRIAAARQKKGWNQSELARALDVTPQTVQHWEKGGGIKQARLAEVAKVLGTSVDWLLFGDDPRVHAVVREPAAPAYVIDGQVPVLALIEVEDWARSGALPERAPSLVSPVEVGPRAFAVRVTGRSMEPRFAPGDIAFVDPDALPAAGRFVVVVPAPSSEAVLREISVEGGERYLSAVNPAWPGERLSPLGPEAIIAGTVVGKWVEV